MSLFDVDISLQKRMGNKTILAVKAAAVSADPVTEASSAVTTSDIEATTATAEPAKKRLKFKKLEIKP